MAMIKCPECGTIVDQNVGMCPNCGYPLKNVGKSPIKEDKLDYISQDLSDKKTGDQQQTLKSEPSIQNNQKTANEIPHSQTMNLDKGSEKSSKHYKTIRNCLIAGMIIFALFSFIFFARALNVRTVYRNNDYYTTNAYVGGDAYNYIINGTYFTGYSVTASSCMICAVVCGVGAAVVGTKKK